MEHIVAYMQQFPVRLKVDLRSTHIRGLVTCTLPSSPCRTIKAMFTQDWTRTVPNKPNWTGLALFSWEHLELIQVFTWNHLELVWYQFNLIQNLTCKSAGPVLDRSVTSTPVPEWSHVNRRPT